MRNPKELFNLKKPDFSFASSETKLFLTGAALSGKSTIAPLIAAKIAGCTIQNMDIFRLLAQDLDSTKPESERNPFLRYGSCDSFAFVGDGSYSPESLIEGFDNYAKAVGALLHTVVPRLEAQGAQNVLFEGVQLTPPIVSPYLTGNNTLIVITADKHRFEENREKRYGSNPVLRERYSTDRLVILQDHLLAQCSRVTEIKRIAYADNSADYLETSSNILQQLIEWNIIIPTKLV